LLDHVGSDEYPGEPCDDVWKHSILTGVAESHDARVADAVEAFPSRLAEALRAIA
jgi:hypothetical protein